ncbi:conserved domain protein [Synechococcus sp. PCC 7335]|uniref:formylglycine-generating enzyme family protein n=1 Tax=Synechococcus sp. (strain ATCC 29403 / PCC 7335) TaxID=91464 RepID=UPI00017ECB26|nr:SUMF1/EgtB/PvdO family nonheme iron enzyme [Synechococcus sp. PCC 7335]EDX87595.1 conserved domain protein [Synechococcus sp. PCC 7335]
MQNRLALLLLFAMVGCSGQESAEHVSEAEIPVTRSACEQQGFVFIEAGDFLRGSDRTQKDYAYRISAEGFADSPEEIAEAEAGYRRRNWFEREPDEQMVNLPAFCLAQNLITNEDYQAFVQSTDHKQPGISAATYQAQGFLVHDYSKVEPYLWQDDQYPAGQGQHPVVLVSYEDALAYAEWRSQQDGVTYRLPTALEWEKAARGTDGRYFPWGSEWRDDATNWARNGPTGTSAIATYPDSRSPYGIEDMAGNVFEYTSTLVEKSNGETEVLLKGCGWDDYPGFCRAAYQHDRPHDSKHILFGFRLTLE